MTNHTSLRKRIATATFGLALILTTAACSTIDDSGSADDSAAVTASGGQVDDVTAELVSATSSTGEIALFDSSVVHDIGIEFDPAEYDAMIATYETTGEKDWIVATITIDGTTIDDVGLRLKGNSSLFGLTSETAESPEDLPWLIRFDKYVDDQSYQDHTELVIRSNSTETAMNEAVALELLGLTGLATEEAIATTFTINGGDTELRLAVELPEDAVWIAANFGAGDGSLYKADSEGDYSYRGDDPDAYDDVFDQKAGDDDLAPLIAFLDFINNSDDETFAAELADRLDVDAFATYLAYQDLVGNADDIDGRGNNSYLYYDGDTDQFTIVNWDLNLAFGTANVGNAPGAGGPGGDAGPGGAGGPGARPEPPTGAIGGAIDPPTGGPGGFGEAAPGALAGGGPARGSNVLVERFMADDVLSDLYADALAELTESLYTSGAGEAIVATWTEVLSEQASDLVDATTVEAEAAAISAWVQAA